MSEQIDLSPEGQHYRIKHVEESLDKHEHECEERHRVINEKFTGIEKRFDRLEIDIITIRTTLKIMGWVFVGVAGVVSPIITTILLGWVNG